MSGLEWMVEAYDCDALAVADLARLSVFLDRLIDELGLHPVGAPLWHKFGGLLSEHGASFYNFRGLMRYKAKFAPEWRSRYLACPGGIRLPQVLFHVSRLIAGGTRRMFRP